MVLNVGKNQWYLLAIKASRGEQRDPPGRGGGHAARLAWQKRRAEDEVHFVERAAFKPRNKSSNTNRAENHLIAAWQRQTRWNEKSLDQSHFIRHSTRY